MTLIPVSLFWPRRSLVLMLTAALGGGWLAHRMPSQVVVAAPPSLAIVRTPAGLPPAAARPGIEELQRYHYRVLRAALIREAHAPEPYCVLCRIVPAIHDSRPVGFRIYAIRPSSLFARLGLQNGDLVSRINGTELTTPDRALEIYARLRESRHIRVEVKRRGVPVQLVYEIID
ncbi:MAG: gspC [Myxococcales bacterium]|nr:gspC [Myxococcales bacterium]